jgi:hypothetical protein
VDDDDKPGSSSAVAPLPHLPWRVLKPGYFRSRAILKRLERFRQLAIHFDRWSGQMDDAVPLETLIGPVPENPMKACERVGQEMNKLVTQIMFDMQLVGVRHTVDVQTILSGRKPMKLSLVADYQNFPQDQQRKRFLSLMQRLDFAVGAYTSRKRYAMWDWCNPLFWVGSAARIPMTVLEYGGLINTQEEHSKFVTFYVWFVRGVTLLCIVLLAAWLGKRLGITIPWNILKKIGLGELGYASSPFW